MATSSSGYKACEACLRDIVACCMAPADPRFYRPGCLRHDKPIPCRRPTARRCLLLSLALADGYLRFKWTQRGNGASTYSGVVYMADDFSVSMPPSRLIYLALVSRPLLIRSAMHAALERTSLQSQWSQLLHPGKPSQSLILLPYASRTTAICARLAVMGCHP